MTPAAGLVHQPRIVVRRDQNRESATHVLHGTCRQAAPVQQLESIHLALKMVVGQHSIEAMRGTQLERLVWIPHALDFHTPAGEQDFHALENIGIVIDTEDSHATQITGLRHDCRTQLGGPTNLHRNPCYPDREHRALSDTRAN